MTKIVTTITGKVEKDLYGSWEDCSPGIYFAGTEVQYMFDKYRGKTLRVTIEEVDTSSEEDEK